MANATSQVWSRTIPYNDGPLKYPILGGSKPKTYQNGQFMGQVLTGAKAGLHTDCDDTQLVKFVGLLAETGGPLGNTTILPADVDGYKCWKIDRGYGMRLTLNTGTVGTINYGQKVYVADNQTVVLDPTLTQFANCAGRIFGVYQQGEPAQSPFASALTISPFIITGATEVLVVPEDYFASQGTASSKRIPLLLGRNSDYSALAASAASGKFGIGGTIDTALWLVSEAAQNTTKTDVWLTEITVPDSFQQTLTINAQRVVAAGTTLTTSLTVNVYPVADAGTEGADLCNTTTAFTNTAQADIVFPVGPGGLAPGTKCLLVVTAIVTEAGNTGTVKTQINSMRLQ